MTNFFTEDYSGTASLPHPSNPKAVELIDPQRKLNTKVWTEAFVQQNRIPLVSPGGLLTVSVRQVNADGAGPYTCRISYAGTEDKWDDKPLKIITNVPGVAGISTAVSTTFPLIVKLPDDLECDGSYGGKKNICMVQCVNGAPNGPFGGCVPIEVKPSAKPPPAPKPYTPPPPPPAKDKAEVKSYADGEDLTKEQLGALTGYYKKKLRLRKLRFFRD
ncbi:hypothetical protein Dda_1469 [Drechslerella dactyloides]|uniref:Uncharacterized protein n=1 Tax=Drechslerella dactyloides TaxID=74499 RepID=A0AAD6J2H8_DREDA|nr:hypothetical protein Dda_1469 [Drechslerella dactyloides]